MKEGTSLRMEAQHTAIDGRRQGEWPGQVLDCIVSGAECSFGRPKDTASSVVDY
jgi:hypothetical protein